MKLFVHIAHEPAAAARAHRGFLVAVAALDQGHTVRMFLAGSAVLLLTEDELRAKTAFGPSLGWYVERVLAGDGCIELSGEAVAARSAHIPLLEQGVVTAADPGRIVELAFECDRVLTYG